MATPTSAVGRPSPAQALSSERFINLTTYRKSGAAVPTPLWFAEEGGNLYAVTGGDSGKMKRIRATARVTVTACDRRGAVHGPSYNGTARILPGAEASRVEVILNRKYGLARRGLGLFIAIARRVRPSMRGNVSGYLEISVTDAV